ncbi:MAG TPA: HD domain-containing protein [Gallionellaceae bacterium]|nr:HD domain-containing protein [Gallionellaceae bacterium]
MKRRHAASEIENLFTPSEPEPAWGAVVEIITWVSPAYDFTALRAVFDDVLRLFHGDYPGYCRIETPYHNLPHTLDVFLCAARLTHALHLSRIKLTDREIALVLTATLLHDVGYAQLRDGTETGTGAQYTPTHVARGIEFMRQYARERGIPADFADDLAPVISCSDPMLSVTNIDFSDERIRLAGKIVGTSDLVGQMADRNYLEKLVLLFQEFQEAGMGGYQSVHDMMRKTENFHAKIQKKLDEDFSGLYRHFPQHFKVLLGEERNLYMESIGKNMEYLSKVTTMDESEYLAQLRRGGIIKEFLSAPPNQ